MTGSLRGARRWAGSLFLFALSACAAEDGASFGDAKRERAPRAKSAEADAGATPISEGSYWLQLSSDDSTSMASAQLARLGMSGGLHRHEFINYYDPPLALSAEEPWSLERELTDSIWLGAKLVLREPAEDGQTGDLLLQLRADAVEPEARRPWHLVYCVDVSGSMEGEYIGFVEDALRRSLDHLRDGDRVSLITFNDDSSVRLTFEEWPSAESAIESAFQQLKAGGSTNMIAGLDDAYEVAQTHHDPARLSRVLLFGDGAANVGETDVDRFASLTRDGNQEGIYLSSVGVGTHFDWARMDQLADAGKGASIFLPDAQEVERTFGRDFYKLVEVAADEVSIELVLPESMELVDFSGEETSTDPDAPVPSVILASGDDITLLARFSLGEGALAEPMSISVSLRPLGSGELVELTEPLEAVEDLVAEAGALHARTAVVDDYARHVIEGSPTLDAVLAAIDAYAAEDEGLAEIRALLER